MCFYKLDFLCLCAISSEKTDSKDEIEITSLFNIPQVPIPRKRQEYKGLFIPSVNYQFVSIRFPGVRIKWSRVPSGQYRGKVFLTSLGKRKYEYWTKGLWENGNGNEGRFMTEGKAWRKDLAKKDNKKVAFYENMKLWLLHLHDLNMK